MEEKTMAADAPNRVSRRNFIKGVIASGAAVSSAGYLWRASTLSGQQPSAPGSVERLITLNVNGQDRRVDVLKQETLATTLRYKLGLTGTKIGCDRAECGACTVLVDDARPEDRHDRGTRGRRRQVAPGAARRGRRTGLPVRLLHVGLHHGDGRFPQDEPESEPHGTGPRDLRQPLSLPGLRQDSHRDDVRC